QFRYLYGVAVALLVAGVLVGTAAGATTTSSQWIVVASPHAGTLNGVSSRAPNDVWSVGFFWSQQAGAYRSLADHWNGSVWKATLPPPGMPGNNVLNAVSGTSSSNVWAVGYQTKRYQSYPTVPLAEHWNGTKWTVARTP